LGHQGHRLTRRCRPCSLARAAPGSGESVMRTRGRRARCADGEEMRRSCRPGVVHEGG